MAKKESSLLQLILSLTLISALAGLALAIVFTKTEKKIRKVAIKKKQEAIMKVLPEFDTIANIRFEKRTYLQDGAQNTVYLHLAYLEDKLLGAAVETYTNKAFNGSFTLMVGLDSEGNILQTEVLQANETPGLGAQITQKKSNFALQFIGKSPENFKIEVEKNGGDVVAITGATITSRAFCDAVARACQAFKTVKE